MNKSDLVQMVARRANLPVTTVEKVTDELVQQLIKAVRKKHSVTIVGLGVFKMVESQRRRARNPQTGEIVNVAPRKKLKFYMGYKLKDILNGGREE